MPFGEGNRVVIAHKHIGSSKRKQNTSSSSPSQSALRGDDAVAVGHRDDDENADTNETRAEETVLPAHMPNNLIASFTEDPTLFSPILDEGDYDRDDGDSSKIVAEETTKVVEDGDPTPRSSEIESREESMADASEAIVPTTSSLPDDWAEALDPCLERCTTTDRQRTRRHGIGHPLMFSPQHCHPLQRCLKTTLLHIPHRRRSQQMKVLEGLKRCSARRLFYFAEVTTETIKAADIAAMSASSLFSESRATQQLPAHHLKRSTICRHLLRQLKQTHRITKCRKPAPLHPQPTLSMQHRTVRRIRGTPPLHPLLHRSKQTRRVTTILWRRLCPQPPIRRPSLLAMTKLLMRTSKTGEVPPGTSNIDRPAESSLPSHQMVFDTDIIYGSKRIRTAMVLMMMMMIGGPRLVLVSVDAPGQWLVRSVRLTPLLVRMRCPQLICLRHGVLLLVCRTRAEAMDPSSGRVYYYRLSTNETTWDRPSLDDDTKETLLRTVSTLSAEMRPSATDGRTSFVGTVPDIVGILHSRIQHPTLRRSSTLRLQLSQNPISRHQRQQVKARRCPPHPLSSARHQRMRILYHQQRLALLHSSTLRPQLSQNPISRHL